MAIPPNKIEIPAWMQDGPFTIHQKVDGTYELLDAHNDIVAQLVWPEEIAPLLRAWDVLLLLIATVNQMSNQDRQRSVEDTNDPASLA